jgi:hypothetical protein
MYLFLERRNVMKLHPRSLAVGVLSAALLIAAVPAAQARSFDRHVVSHPASWFDAALAWLSGQLVGAPQEPAARSPQTKATGILTTPGHGATPMTGSCLDPNGLPKPCSPGGGTGGI